jgi:hypothetical protein
MRTLRYFLQLILLLNLLACGNPEEEKKTGEQEVNAYTIPSDLPQNVEDLVQKHHIKDFYKKEVISFEIQLTFNGKERLKATIFSRTNSGKVKVEKADGTVMLFDGEDVFINPDTAFYKGARFDALTWSYFALAPFKFTDEGTKWGDTEKMLLRNENDSLKSIKLSFENGIGDAPDDWYQIYINPETGLLEAMAYIVTFGKTSQNDAEKNPHAIAYSNYQSVEGVLIAGNWKFYNWSKSTGLGEQLGEAIISNIHFMEETEGLFMLGAESKRVPAE